jgi:adenylosuccinate synthase
MITNSSQEDMAMVTAIVGANWGDEGKGKITDMLGQESDIIVRFQGGSNAGHTIINDYGKFALHLLPSGVFYNHTTCIIGNGVALNIPYLVKEIDDLVAKGVPKPKILVSNRAQILMPYHIKFDEYEEERLGKASFGSTKSGIAPFYSDKYAKIGFQVSELFADEKTLREKIARVCVQKNVILEHLYKKPVIDEDELYRTLMEYRKMVEPYACDTSAFIRKAIADGKNVLLEGQLGTLKDPDFGIYPMVTSSSTLAAYGAIGAGIPPYEIKRIVTVVKAYSSAVGAGEFVSEIFGEEADELRKRGGDGGEFGATTGRPRRMGWFDAVASRYGCKLQGATDVALTVLDVLGYLDELPVCVGYEIDGKVTKDFPTTVELAKAKPVYEKLPGWKTDIRGIKKYEDLPENCRKYIEFIEKELEVPVTMVSNGPNRNDIIYREK